MMVALPWFASSDPDNTFQYHVIPESSSRRQTNAWQSGAEPVNIDRKDTIVQEAGKIGFAELDSMIRQIIATGAFLDQNANPKLAMAALGAMIG